MEYPTWKDEVKARLVDYHSMDPADASYAVDVEEVDVMNSYYKGDSVEEVARKLCDSYGM